METVYRWSVYTLMCDVVYQMWNVLRWKDFLEIK
jgi:hypothetical protein